jgi:hypothetical protein
MKPLEVMAKAHWADSENTAWESLLAEDRAHMVNMMRAALLALAEVELPEAALSRGLIAMACAKDHAPEETFRAMLRAIAEAPDA